MRLPPVTLLLLISIVVVYLIQWTVPAEYLVAFELWPLGRFDLGLGQDGRMVTGGFQPWQLLTYGLMHGSPMHLLFNGFTLYQFGSAVESALGSRRFLFFFLFCVFGAGLCQLFVTTAMLAADGSNAIPTVGASGGIFGLLLAYAVFYPRARIIFFLIPVPVPARYAVLIYGAIELYLGLSGAQSGVAHFAHLGGLLFGAVLLYAWRRRPPPRSPAPPDNPFSSP
ncbi:rhomboid family intramembrane serine protease [Arenimonas oryziterrae]|uniref:Peptidase S54 rhomboid domain-containing protein n=1 Tax=Arenimonas oryziterrae DSM 21050 = YC6267 TaxID=1121015 RepID=A0A091B025_9GAMM|nr:rhomboid family intramembrane serine protease [Arenimonas oryziterrae]KFN44907.1 hypothetical protein N789_02490 [Arenimonas oryziterrae DSM 21050 = YC6267]